MSWCVKEVTAINQSKTRELHYQWDTNETSGAMRKSQEENFQQNTMTVSVSETNGRGRVRVLRAAER